MDARQQRGMAIAASGGAQQDLKGWRVESQVQPGRRYRVNPLAQSCTCPDFEDRNEPCKHVFAVLFVMTAEQHADGTVTTTTERVTYSQNWSAYNEAQVNEKDTFMRLLADLCSGVPQPEQTTGRPRLPLGEMIFAATFKVYSGFSSRRFQSDLRGAHEHGLISRVPHFNSVTNYMASEELTKSFDVTEVSADKAYLTKAACELVEQVGATPYIPFKKNSRPVLNCGTAWERMWHRFAADPEQFASAYHKRSNVETTFSMIKGKFGDALMSKSTTGQINEVLCKVLAHNIVCVAQAAIEFGIDPTYAPTAVC